MSSQLLVHGFLEIPSGSEQENAKRLAALATATVHCPNGLAGAMSPPQPGWPLPVVAFAKSYKNTSEGLAHALRLEFEFILRNLALASAVSAHLCIYDEEGLNGGHYDYVLGPTKALGPDVWTVVTSRLRLVDSVERPSL